MILLIFLCLKNTFDAKENISPIMISLSLNALQVTESRLSSGLFIVSVMTKFLELKCQKHWMLRRWLGDDSLTFLNGSLPYYASEGNASILKVTVPPCEALEAGSQKIRGGRYLERDTRQKIFLIVFFKLQLIRLTSAKFAFFID